MMSFYAPGVSKFVRLLPFVLDLLWYLIPRSFKYDRFILAGWCGEIRDVIFSDNGTVTVVYRVTIRGSDGEVCLFLYFSLFYLLYDIPSSDHLFFSSLIFVLLAAFFIFTQLIYLLFFLIQMAIIHLGFLKISTSRFTRKYMRSVIINWPSWSENL